jgi:hypothetical protein
METKKSLEKSHIFLCNFCDYYTSKKNDYDKHLSTRKHVGMVTMETLETKKSLKVARENVAKHNECKKCKKIYNTRSGLWKHTKTCNVGDNETIISSRCFSNMSHIHDNEVSIGNAIVTDNEDDTGKNVLYNAHNKDELLLKLIKNSEEMMKVIKEQQEQLKEQQEQMSNIIPKIGNTFNNTTNNNFNLNVFLNEHCKDALNISDFIDSLKITLEDLEFSKINGISRGITDVMIKGLKELDIYRRPIHCTDVKRDIMYIKDEDKWSKDQNHDIIKNTIVKIADKERTALQQWAIDNPDWIETESKQIQYLKMMKSICEPIENYNNYEKKIIKNVGKEIIIDKK